MKQAASATPPEAAASPKKVLKDALRGSFLTSMRSAREKKAGGSGSNPGATGANNEKVDQQQPLDLDQFGINSPKAPHAKPAKTTKPQSPGGMNTKISKQQNESEKSEITPFGPQKSLDLAGQSASTPAGHTNPGFMASNKFSKEVLESEPEMSAASPDRSPFRK